jgi:hypothetical protein
MEAAASGRAPQTAAAPVARRVVGIYAEGRMRSGGEAQREDAELAAPALASWSWDGVPAALPLGVPLGIRYGGGSPDDLSGVIRLGRDLVTVDAALYDAWQTLRVPQDLLATKPPSIAKVQLEERGLVLRLPPDPDRALSTLDDLLPSTCGLGAGNTPAYPDAFAIVSHEYRPLAVVDAATYAVWTRAGAGFTVAAACAAAAVDFDDPVAVRRALLRSLPVLIACGVLFLEPGPGEGDA